LRISVTYPTAVEFNRRDIEAIRRAIDAPIEFSMTGGFGFTVDLSAVRAADRMAYMRKAMDRIGAAKSVVGAATS